MICRPYLLRHNLLTLFGCKIYLTEFVDIFFLIYNVSTLFVEIPFVAADIVDIICEVFVGKEFVDVPGYIYVHDEAMLTCVSGYVYVLEGVIL